MKTKDFTKIGKQLLPQLPGFVIEGKIVFKSPINDFLRGLCFESSTDANCFYLWMFFLPLFIPRDAVGLTHGKRLRNKRNEGWYVENLNLLTDLTAAIQNEAMPFLENVSTLAGTLEYLKTSINSGRPRVNSHELEALAYTLIKFGDYPSALKSLAELKERLESSTIPWVIEQRKRAELIEDKLLQNPEAALAQLEAWKTETIANLGLERHVVSAQPSADLR